jgi:hypothetical protein
LGGLPARFGRFPAETYVDSVKAWPLDSISQVSASDMTASLIGRWGSSTFRLSTTPASMSLTGSRFSSESAPGPFHHGVRERGGTIYWAALPAV